MLRRLRIYFTGFGIGLVMVYIFFGKDDSRDLDIWTPSQRILEEVRADSSLLNGSVWNCVLTCLSLDSAQAIALITDAQVESLNPGGNPYRYKISLKENNLHVSVVLAKLNARFRLESSTNEITGEQCSCAN